MLMIYIVILFFMLFFWWTYNMKRGNCSEIDNFIYEKIKFKDIYTRILRVLTVFASVKYFVLLMVLLLVFMSDKKLVFLMIIFLIFDAILIESLKKIFKRNRPNIKRLVKEHGYSYPSGHSVSATAFYGFLIYLVLVSVLSLPMKVIIIFFLLIFILIITFSRIYLGVHYFSDVIGGILLGSFYVSLYVYLLPLVVNFI